MESYQAIYDAVRSRISGGNIAEAIQSVIRDANLSFYADQVSQHAYRVLSEYERPSVKYRPTVVPDGNKWSALYGENLMEGVCGFGDTPEEAMRDFDNNWWKQKTPEAIKIEQKIAEEDAHEKEINNGQFGVGA